MFTFQAGPVLAIRDCLLLFYYDNDDGGGGYANGSGGDEEELEFLTCYISYFLLI